MNFFFLYFIAVNVLQVIFRDKGLGELKLSVVPGARLGEWSR